MTPPHPLRRRAVGRSAAVRAIVEALVFDPATPSNGGSDAETLSLRKKARRGALAGKRRLR